MEQTEVTEKHADEMQDIDSEYLRDRMFEERATKTIIGWIEKTFGLESALLLEAYLNKKGTSLLNTYQEAEKISEALQDLFDEGASLIVLRMNGEAMQSNGINPDYLRENIANLKNALELVRVIGNKLTCLSSSLNWR